MCRKLFRGVSFFCALTLGMGPSVGCTHVSTEPDVAEIDEPILTGDEASPDDPEITEGEQVAEPGAVEAVENPDDPESLIEPAENLREQTPAEIQPETSNPIQVESAPSEATPLPGDSSSTEAAETPVTPDPITAPEIPAQKGYFSHLLRPCFMHEGPSSDTPVVRNLDTSHRIWTEPVNENWVRVYAHGKELYMYGECFAAVHLQRGWQIPIAQAVGKVESQPPQHEDKVDPPAETQPPVAATVAPAVTESATVKPEDPTPTDEEIPPPPPQIVPAASSSSSESSGTEAGFAAGLVAGLLLFGGYLLLRRKPRREFDTNTQTMTFV